MRPLNPSLAGRSLGVFLACICVVGCGLKHSVKITNRQVGELALPKTRSSDVVVTEGDIDRAYSAICDIEVQIFKRNRFLLEPTKADAYGALRDEGANVGADAVIFARDFYAICDPGSVCIIAVPRLVGTGRAIKFVGADNRGRDDGDQ